VLHFCSCDVLRHIDAFVCLPHGDRFPSHCLRTLLQAHAALSTIATRPFPFACACPTLDLAANWHSNPIAHRVRRKRQRLPPSLLIENASDRDSHSAPKVCPETFPIKASDNKPGMISRHSGLSLTGIAIGPGKFLHPRDRSPGAKGRGRGRGSGRSGSGGVRERSEAGAPCRVISFATVFIANEKTT
jgi:hypothetical protein